MSKWSDEGEGNFNSLLIWLYVFFCIHQQIWHRIWYPLCHIYRKCSKRKGMYVGKKTSTSVNGVIVTYRSQKLRLKVWGTGQNSAWPPAETQLGKVASVLVLIAVHYMQGQHQLKTLRPAQTAQLKLSHLQNKLVLVNKLVCIFVFPCHVPYRGHAIHASVVTF